MSFSTAVILKGRNKRCWRLLLFLCNCVLLNFANTKKIKKMGTNNPPKMQIDNVIFRMDDDLLNRKTNLGQSGSKRNPLLPIWFFPRCYRELFKSDLTLLFKTVDNVPNHHLMAFHRRLRRSWNGICSETKTKISRLGSAKEAFFIKFKMLKRDQNLFSDDTMGSCENDEGIAG